MSQYKTHGLQTAEAIQELLNAFPKETNVQKITRLLSDAEHEKNAALWTVSQLFPETYQDLIELTRPRPKFKL
jgi:ribosomal 50S subunit-associated protein YjgA (DUF615 family)